MDSWDLPTLDWIGWGKSRSVGQCHEGHSQGSGLLNINVMMPPPWEIPETQMDMSSIDVRAGHSGASMVQVSFSLSLFSCWIPGVGVGSQLHHDPSGSRLLSETFWYRRHPLNSHRLLCTFVYDPHMEFVSQLPWEVRHTFLLFFLRFPHTLQGTCRVFMTPLSWAHGINIFCHRDSPVIFTHWLRKATILGFALNPLFHPLAVTSTAPVFFINYIILVVSYNSHCM